MTIHVRELIIKTNIVSDPSNSVSVLSDDQLQQMKKEIVQECLQRVKDEIKKQPKR